MIYRWWFSCIFIFMFALSGSANADMVTDWNIITLETIKAAKLTSTKASRVLAMVHAAIYDSVNAIDKTHGVYFVHTTANPGTSEEAAAAAAAHIVLTQLYPGQALTLDAALATSLASLPDGQAKADGIALGQMVGEAIVEWRTGDHSDDMVPYTPGTTPGKWRPTPPDFKDAMTPHWRFVTPFTTKYIQVFRYILRPPSLYSYSYAKAVKYVQNIGSKTSLTRSTEQTMIAHFWADMPGTETTVGRWNLIAQSAAVTQGNTLSENARLFALLNITLADAGIVAWDLKYYYNFWRPVTAINEADTDFNWLTVKDPNWEPLLNTPPFPEFVSAHSTFSAAAAGILKLFFNDDNISFTVQPYMMGMPSMPRTYYRFSDASNEAGKSRIYGGIHYDFSNTSGLWAGNELSKYVLRTFMRPL
jgi:hypothetical protein